MSLPELTYKTKESATVRLGEVVDALMNQCIGPSQCRLDPVREAWLRIVPPGLAGHCRIKGVSRGELRVGVDSPVYMQELQWCHGELLKELQTQVPRAGLRKIRFQLG